MKIDSISNMSYSPISQQGSTRTSKTAAPEQNSQANAKVSSSHSGLTNAERAFFAKLFPESSSQIHTHSTYSPSGVHSTVEPGQIINRKV